MQTEVEKYFQMEEMVQLLIRIIGKSNEKITMLEEKLKQLEETITMLNMEIEGIKYVMKKMG